MIDGDWIFGKSDSGSYLMVEKREKKRERKEKCFLPMHAYGDGLFFGGFFRSFLVS